MKVLMLIPPIPASMPATWFLREERHAAVDATPTAPYMAPAILGMLRQTLPQAEFRVLDTMAEAWPERWDAERIEAEVAAYGPDLVVSILCANHLGEREERLCSELPYPTINVATPLGPDIAEAVELYDLRGKYWVATDETEVITARAAEELLRSGRVESTPGILVNENGKTRFTGFAGYSDMQTYPRPAFELFPWERYNRIQDEITSRRPEYRDTAIINGMKGCPFHCSFCIVGGDLTRARTKNGRQIFEEVTYLHDHYGRRRFNFLDSEFAANKKTAKDFCRLVIDSGIKITFDVKNRIEFWDEDLLTLMKRAGCQAMYYGIETADPRLQQVIKKNLDLDKARTAIAVTKKAGIQVHLFMMVGILGETRESLRKNAEFIAAVKPDGIAWGILFPEVGSPLYEEMKAKGLLLEKDWAKYRRLDGLSFKHETYRSMDDIRLASLWMRNRYRRALALDASLPPRERLAYLARYGAGIANYATWRATNRHPRLKRLRAAIGYRLGQSLSRFGGRPLL